MKKIFFVLIAVAMLSACTKTNTQQESAVATNTKESGKDDSTVITPRFHTVEPGDCAWNIAKAEYGKGQMWLPVLVDKNNPELQEGITLDSVTKQPAWCDMWPGKHIFLGYDTAKFQKKEPAVLSKSEKKPVWWLEDWVGDIACLLLILAGIVGLFFLIRWLLAKEKERKERNSNPVTAGPPMVPGGVEPKDARGVLLRKAIAENPNSNVRIKNIRKGKLFGKGTVRYGDGTNKRIKLHNADGYAGEIEVDGYDQTIYFLQGCGNDVRYGGRYMTGLTFVPEQTINQAGEAVPLTEESLVAETPVVVPEQPIEQVTSESHQRKLKILKFVEDVLAKDDKMYKITIKEGDLDVVIEYNKDASKDVSKKPKNG